MGEKVVRGQSGTPQLNSPLYVHGTWGRGGCLEDLTCDWKNRPSLRPTEPPLLQRKTVIAAYSINNHWNESAIWVRLIYINLENKWILLVHFSYLENDFIVVTVTG